MERNWPRLILIGLLVWIAFIVVSCDAHKQLSRLIKKHPELVRDTSIVDYDTTIFHLPAVHKDSVVHIRSFMTDTIYLKQDRLTVKTYVHNDSVYIEGDCAEVTDTIIETEIIKVPYVVNVEKKQSWLWIFIIVVFCQGWLMYQVYRLKKK